MKVVTITTAAELFLDDISAEDYQEVVADHEPDCACDQCIIFTKLIELDQVFSRYLTGLPVPKQYIELCRKKEQRYNNE